MLPTVGLVKHSSSAKRIIVSLNRPSANADMAVPSARTFQGVASPRKPDAWSRLTIKLLCVPSSRIILWQRHRRLRQDLNGC